MILHHISKYEFESFDMKVKARGNTRRISGLCDFPPLKLKFKKEDLVEDGYSPNYKSFKLVTHCLDSKKEQQNKHDKTNNLVAFI